MKRFTCGVLCGVLELTAGLLSVAAAAEPSVTQTMDDIVTRLYATKDSDELAKIDHASAAKFITDEERKVLATKYWYFDVDVPVIVSVMRNTDQQVVPFWLPEAEFTKTDRVVTNSENWDYEVWQKEFDAGRVELGINGFGKHRAHYFVTVGPRNEGDAVEISNLFPERYSVGMMREGAFFYNDWDELVVQDMPRSLRGHKLLTTTRGRAREAHLVGGFRQTAWPSTKEPMQVVLTWSDDPKTSQTVQWRTSTNVAEGVVQYKQKGSARNYLETAASHERIENRLLSNDRYCHRHTAVLRGLKPATTYLYRAGTPDAWSDKAEFITAPDGAVPFTFVSFGDTHKKKGWGEMLEKTLARHPQTAFYTIAGDLVDTGQYRDDWDQFFAYSSMVFNQRPIMPSIGNHDNIDGLGPAIYLSHFGLPENGPEHLEMERTYAFEYSNAMFLVLDCTAPVAGQSAWIEQQLASSKATWKFAVFHFPPYNLSDPYPEIKSRWGDLFDKYHLDFSLEGHVHYYMRSHPIRREKPVASPAEGTIHVISIAVPSRPGSSNRRTTLPPADYAAVQFRGTQLYQIFDIDGDKLTYRACDPDGNIKDELVIEK